jgi:hypothetical protein
MLKNSAIGPNARDGKKDKAATTMITARVMIPNVPVSVWSVPADSGMYFFLASIPAMATGPTIGKNLDRIITMPQLMFQKGTPSPNPSNPLPLLADEEVYSYNISENPW